MVDNNQRDGNIDLLLRKILGLFFLAIAVVTGFWIVSIISQLWDSPSSIGLVSLFIDLTKEQSVISTANGDIQLPDFVPISSGVFLCMMLVSSVGLLMRTFLSSSIALLFPKVDKICCERSANKAGNRLNDEN